MATSQLYQDYTSIGKQHCRFRLWDTAKTMGASIIFPIIFAVFAIHSAASQEKVLFGQPSSIAAEARQSSASDAAKDATVAKDGGGRKARVFTFPGASNQQQQDPRTHQPSYVISSPYEDSSPYETTEDRFAAAAAASQDDNNRLLSFLPTFGDNGMQVGLDFKLPFFQIPYAKMFSSGGLGGLFANRYGGLPAASSTSSLAHGTLGSSLLGSSSSMATMAAMAVTAAMLYPKVSNMFSLDGKGVFRDGGSTDDFFHNMNSVLGQFNIDGESCLKVALCSLGNAKQRQHTRGRNAAQGTSTPADVVDNILNLPQVKKFMSKGTLTQARDFGGSGGDCDYFNDNSKCPVSAQTFQSMFSSLG